MQTNEPGGAREPRVSTPVIAAIAFGFVSVLLLSFAVEAHDRGFGSVALAVSQLCCERPQTTLALLAGGCSFAAALQPSTRWA